MALAGISISSVSVQSVSITAAIGAPLDFCRGLISTINEKLGDPIERLAINADPSAPVWSLEEHAERMEGSVKQSAHFGALDVMFGVTATERARLFDRFRARFDAKRSYVSWTMHSLAAGESVSAVETASQLLQIEEAGFSTGAEPFDRYQRRAARIRALPLESYEQNLVLIRRDLLGIAPVQWFGPAFVEAFGGDSVFEGLPDGWAERVKPGLWKVSGAEDPEDPDAFQVESWSDRERALIEALGPEFFFNVETGELATEFVEIPIASQYPVYLWDDAAGELVIHEPDGSTRPANLDELAPDPVVVRVGPPDVAHLVFDRMNDVMGDESFEVDDQLYWVELHLENLSELDDVWVERFSVWLGEHVIKGILDAKWVERDGRWVVLSSRGVFDPEQVVHATVGSAAPVARRAMVSAACEAMGLPLP